MRRKVWLIEDRELNMSMFPRSFLFGVATSSYQVEGGWNQGGKGENIWDRLLHSNPDFTDDKSNADVACDSYNLYKNDVQLIKEVGFEFYRFSISWSRILPSGEHHDVNLEGINYYNKLINELLSNNIIPMVTMYHWDLPQKLQDVGGWMNPLIEDYFESYATVLFRHFGDRVKWWMTINEPTEIVAGYADSVYAPALDRQDGAEYLVAHHILKAHARVYRCYDKVFRPSQKGKVSIGLSGPFAFPSSNSEEDEEAALRHMECQIGWLADPIYGPNGDYPSVLKERVLSRSLKEGRTNSKLPSFTREEVQFIKGSSDFFAYQHYSSVEVTSGGQGKDSSWHRDIDVKYVSTKNWPASKLFWMKIVPEGFRNILTWIKERYSNPAIFITENGFGDLEENDLLDDQRVQYFTCYLQELHKAINENECNIIGYTAWSLLDNFEWKFGYTAKFGIVHVDFEDPKRKRTLKKSAEFFKSFLQTREIFEC